MAEDALAVRQPIRVLVLEDNPADAELMIWQLRHDGFEPEWERVEHLDDFAVRLRPELDVILADYRLPGFSAPKALQLLKRSELAVPFIVISGTIDEEQAVDCMRHGAADYFFKDRLARLGGAVRQAIEDRRLRNEKFRAEEASRENKERARLALEAGRMGVVQFDVQSETVTLDATSVELLGLESAGQQVSPEIILERIHSDDRERVREEILRTLRTNETFEIEFRTIAPDESEFWILARGRVLRAGEGHPLRVLAVIIETTQRKRVEKELARARDVAEAANRAKDEFLAALSHELRTPLNPVLLLASEKENSPAVPEELRADFAFLRQHIELEARLIDDLLDLNRIVAGRLRLSMEPLDVHEILRQSIQIVRGEMRKKRIRLTTDLKAVKCWMQGDPVRVQQVFWNILNNAIKFTPPQGGIEVRSWNDAEVSSLHLAFRDTGIGMTPEELRDAFRTFTDTRYRDGVNRHRFGGLGLGLAICKALVEMHHGQISASSAGHGQGAVFRVEFPLAPTEAIAPSYQKAPHLTEEPSIPHGLKILLIEDHKPTRMTLARILGRHGHSVIETDSVSGARQLLDEGEFDLILSDIGLPDGTGYDLLEELRARGDMTPAIALSGYGMESDVERSLEYGFSSHLTKPVEIQALERAISNTVEHPISHV